jgi:hypothetical protein
MRRIKILSAITMLTGIVAVMNACDKTDRSFSLLSESNSFKQSANYTPRKIDILWIIDNSGSMDTSQNNLATNFQSFIQRFETLNYDFRMAVQKTDGFQEAFSIGSGTKRLHASNLNSPQITVMDPNTANLATVFTNNAKVGTTGTGDERAFQSIMDTLNYTGNADFRRPEAFLAVIIVSDEEDFSRTQNGLTDPSCYFVYPLAPCNAESWNPLINLPGLHTVDSYKAQLDQFAGVGNYSVNAITIMDSTCRDQLNTTFTGRRIGTRYMDLVNKTSGISTSLCGNFADSLQLISDQIITTTATFTLDREPVVESIAIYVDGVLIPNDAINGWTYDSTTWTISFHGSAIPKVGANVQIFYDPKTAKN